MLRIERLREEHAQILAAAWRSGDNQGLSSRKNVFRREGEGVPGLYADKPVPDKPGTTSQVRPYAFSCLKKMLFTSRIILKCKHCHKLAFVLVQMFSLSIYLLVPLCIFLVPPTSPALPVYTLTIHVLMHTFLNQQLNHMKNMYAKLDRDPTLPPKASAQAKQSQKQRQQVERLSGSAAP